MSSNVFGDKVGQGSNLANLHVHGVSKDAMQNFDFPVIANKKFLIKRLLMIVMQLIVKQHLR